jgi:hypothetical protein
MRNGSADVAASEHHRTERETHSSAAVSKIRTRQRSCLRGDVSAFRRTCRDGWCVLLMGGLTCVRSASSSTRSGGRELRAATFPLPVKVRAADRRALPQRGVHQAARWATGGDPGLLRWARGVTLADGIQALVHRALEELVGPGRPTRRGPLLPSTPTSPVPEGVSRVHAAPAGDCSLVRTVCSVRHVTSEPPAQHERVVRITAL